MSLIISETSLFPSIILSFLSIVYFICSDSILIDIEAILSTKDILIISNLLIDIISTNCFSWRASRSDIDFVKLFNSENFSKYYLRNVQVLKIITSQNLTI